MGAASAAMAQTHSYDLAGRLTKATYPNGSFVSYSYDAAGNLLAVTTSETPAITTAPAAATVALGSSTALQVAATGSGLTYQWRRNGQTIAGATSPTYTVAALQPGDAGLYTVLVASASGTTETVPVLLAPVSTEKLVGAGDSLPDWQNIRHPSGNLYDQVLMTGPAVTVRADPGQVTRISFIDVTDDIVQVEFSGAGSLSVVLEEATGPAPPALYNQAVGYMKGRPSVVIAGADETTYVSVFSVGRANAVIPYPRLIELGYPAAQLSAAGITVGVVPTDKVPSAMGGNGVDTFLSRAQASALFKSTATYDGIADVRALSVRSTAAKLGGVFGGNMRYGADRGPIGIHAPGVAVSVRVVLHDLRAEAGAQPMLQLASSPATLVAGGSLRQINAQTVRLDALLTLQMVGGSTSHGVSLAGQVCRARFERGGADVTAQLTVQGP
jgi:YD repeat-containing protein